MKSVGSAVLFLLTGLPLTPPSAFAIASASQRSQRPRIQEAVISATSRVGQHRVISCPSAPREDRIRQRFGSRTSIAVFPAARVNAFVVAVAGVAGEVLWQLIGRPSGARSIERRKPAAAVGRTLSSRDSPVTMLGAWRCSGRTNAELIKNLIDANLVHTPRAAKAMQNTDRGFYTRQDAYEDRPQPIGHRATISAPHMHAHALEVLSPVIPAEGAKVLDVGCGSGYLSGALARLVGADGVVFGMDYIPELVDLTKANIVADDEGLLDSGRVVLKTGDGWKGWAEKGPFDAIHVGAAAETIPEDLVSQLKVGGRMVVPVGPQSASQMLVQVDRIKDSGPVSESYTTTDLMAVVYVPLVST